MKVFETVRTQYMVMGISPTNQPDRRCPFNERIFAISVSIGCSVISQLWYIHKANSFVDRMECIGSLSAGIIVFSSFAAIVFRKTKLFKSVGDIEKLIDSSEFMSKLQFIILKNESNE